MCTIILSEPFNANGGFGVTVSLFLRYIHHRYAKKGAVFKKNNFNKIQFYYNERFVEIFCF